jgi:hypothetical protein
MRTHRVGLDVSVNRPSTVRGSGTRSHRAGLDVDVSDQFCGAGGSSQGLRVLVPEPEPTANRSRSLGMVRPGLTRAVTVLS